MTHDPQAIPAEDFRALHSQRIAEMQDRYAMFTPPVPVRRGPYVKLPDDVRAEIYRRRNSSRKAAKP